VDIDKAAEAFQKFDQFKKRILTPNDVVDIQGKLYLKKGAWTKWALVCNVSDRLVSYDRVPPEGKDDDGGFYYRVVWEAFHQPTGRSSVGTGITSSQEKKSWAHEEHDIFATACTRAKNRAVSNLVGGGEVSAEEMTSDGGAVAPTNSSSEKSVGTTKPMLGEGPLSETETGQAETEYPLQYAGKNVGLARVYRERNQILFIPDKPFRSDAGPIVNFLVPKVLEATKKKHPEFGYNLRVKDGIVEAVVVQPIPLVETFDDLLGAMAWAFQKGSETK
jgi:hypothetical protein